MNVSASFLVVAHWTDGPGYREVDCILHDRKLAEDHRKMLRKECGVESVLIIGFQGANHGEAAQEAFDAITDGARFGRKAFAAICAKHGVDGVMG